MGIAKYFSASFLTAQNDKIPLPLLISQKISLGANGSSISSPITDSELTLRVSPKRVNAFFGTISSHFRPIALFQSNSLSLGWTPSPLAANSSHPALGPQGSLAFCRKFSQ
jgi:hypothetical protein